MTAMDKGSAETPTKILQAGSNNEAIHTSNMEPMAQLNWNKKA